MDLLWWLRRRTKIAISADWMGSKLGTELITSRQSMFGAAFRGGAPIRDSGYVVIHVRERSD
jgi:hypothetical protein